MDMDATLVAKRRKEQPKVAEKYLLRTQNIVEFIYCVMNMVTRISPPFESIKSILNNFKSELDADCLLTARKATLLVE